jgi:hypothetical protein
MNLSVVIPVFNDAESVMPLLAQHSRRSAAIVSGVTSGPPFSGLIERP